MLTSQRISTCRCSDASGGLLGLDVVQSLLTAAIFQLTDAARQRANLTAAEHVPERCAEPVLVEPIERFPPCIGEDDGCVAQVTWAPALRREGLLIA